MERAHGGPGEIGAKRTHHVLGPDRLGLVVACYSYCMVGFVVYYTVFGRGATWPQTSVIVTVVMRSRKRHSDRAHKLTYVLTQ